MPIAATGEKLTREAYRMEGGKKINVSFFMLCYFGTSLDLCVCVT